MIVLENTQWNGLAIYQLHVFSCPLAVLETHLILETVSNISMWLDFNFRVYLRHMIVIELYQGR